MCQRANKSTICGVIVTYFPDAQFIDRIERVASQVDHTVIVDNGSPESRTNWLRHISDQFPVHLILNGRNEGLARALNTGARWAIERGYSWILTLDQDTTALPHMVHSLVEIAAHYRDPKRLAVIGSNYIHKQNGTLFWNRKGLGDSRSSAMTTVVTSGSLISLRAFRSIGGFREDFFIDCVDHEFCLRARSRGFHIAMSRQPLMEHGIGHLSEHRVLWRKVGTSNHSPMRQYFMARNSVILMREYMSKEPRWIVRYLWAWMKSIALICLLEDDRIAKTKHIIRGCVDGLLGQTGSVGVETVQHLT